MGRRPEMDDAETQPAHGDRHTMQKTTAADDCRFWCITVVFAVVLTACIFIPIEYYGTDTHYSVAIDSVSGLNPRTTGLSFNLTLAVASRSYGSKSCINPGTYVEVSYGGVQLAASVPETRALCASPRKAVQQRVMAMLATGVPIGNLLHSLTEDMRKGVAAFDVTLHLPAGSYGGRDGATELASQCKGKRVGEAAVPCDSPNQEAMYR